MKRLLYFLLIVCLLFGTFFVMPVGAASVTVTVTTPVTVTATSDWDTATYTCKITDGTFSSFGILSNGKYNFRYYPGTGEIKALDAADLITFQPGYTGVSVVYPTSIDAFTTTTPTGHSTWVTTYNAQTITTLQRITIPVTVSGVYQGINDWENATYTYTLGTSGSPLIYPATTGKPYGILSNGKYNFLYFPDSGYIQPSSTATDSNNAVFSYSNGNNNIPIVFPINIGSFTIGSTTYPAKSIVINCPNGNSSVFRGIVASVQKISDVIIPEGVTNIPTYAFCQIDQTQTTTRFILPSTLTSIGTSAFAPSSNGGYFIDFTLPDSLTSIGSSAFQITRFKNIVIPSGVTDIKTNTFYANNQLQNVTFKGQVTNIGTSAFRNCYALKTVTFQGKTAPTIVLDNANHNNDSFAAVTQALTIYYPADGVGYEEGSAFQTAIKYNSTNTIFTPVSTSTSCTLSSVTPNASGYTIGYNITLGAGVTNSKNLIALYNGNNLVAVKEIDNAQSSVTINTSGQIANKATIFVWESYSTIKPLCDSKFLTF